MKSKPTYEELLKKVEYYKKELKNVKNVNFEIINQYYKKLFDFSNAPIIVWNSNFEIILFDKASELLTGYTSEEILGKKMNYLSNPRKILKIKEKINYPAKKESWETILPLVCKNGETKILLCNLANIFDNNGVLISTIAQGHDITGIKKTEQALQIEHTKLNTILNSLEDAVYLSSLDYDILYMNSKMIQEIGKDGINQKCYKIIYNLNEPCSWCYFNKLKKNEKSNIEIVRNNKHYTISSTLLNDNSKLTVYHDITDIKNAQKETVKLTTAVEQSPNTIIITDIEGNIEYVNPKFTELTGYSSKEVIGKNITILNSGTHSNNFFKNLWEIINTGKTWKGEIQNKNKKGDLYWEQTTITPIKNAKGSITNFLAIKEDYTAKKEAELKLIENEKKFRKLIEQSPISIQTINRFGKIEQVNSAFLKLWGLNQDGVTAIKEKYNILEDSQLKALGVLPYIKRAFNGETVIVPPHEYDASFTFKMLGIKEKNVGKNWLEVRLYPVKGKKGELESIVMLSENITKFKKAELKLKEQNELLVIAKDKAEESDRLKTEFLNNMSHEIRTPMNGILGFSELLCSTDITNEKRSYFGKIIKNSGNQLLQVIDDILEISKLGTKQVKAIEKEVCLNNLMLNLFSIFDIKAKENKIPLYLKNGLNDEESTIFTDELKLNKILSNLLENAFKFTNEGFIEFGYHLKNKFIDIYVKDTGIGINKKSQKIIFERFSQEEKELSQKFGGLGLGLSIAKENSELLGGTITLDSEKGNGAVFTVSIPYNPVIPKNNIQPISDNSEGKFVLLIVEDEEVNYLFLETLLIDSIKLDCILIHAKNGKEAVDICKSNSAIDFILMDIKMPIMNGYEATKLIKEFNPNIPIIAQTAYSTSEDKAKAISAGCDDFVSKPIRKKTLKEVLHKYLKII